MIVLPIPLLLAHQWVTAAVLWAVASLHAAWLTHRVGRFNRFVVSLVAVFTTVLTLRSFALAISGRTVVWKGRRLRPDGVEQPGVEQPRVEQPRVEQPRVEQPRPSTPQQRRSA